LSTTLSLLGCVISLGVMLLRRNSAPKRSLSSIAKFAVKFVELVININSFFNKIV
jgi:hypothetical protein